MNNLIDNFAQILEFAKNYGLPPEKKRAILREYLQSRILEIIYAQKIAKDLIFSGGTALRLLRGLDRFSEDLDFDLSGNLNFNATDRLMEMVAKRLSAENINNELYRNKRPARTYYELRFSHLLSDLNLTKNKDEKLMIKLDFEKLWKAHEKEIVIFKRYGLLANVVTATLDNFLIQKLAAYCQRSQTMPRDIYDLVWLFSQGAKFERKFSLANNIPTDILIQAEKKFVRERKSLNSYKKRLQPFLINEENKNKLNFFPELVKLSRPGPG